MSTALRTSLLSAGSTLLVSLALALGMPGQSWAQAGGDRPPPKVPVFSVKPTDTEVFKTYTGRTEANRHVEVRAQVDGILESREYTEGSRVEEGDPLFRIDPRPYQAAVNEAQADVASAEATLAAAQRDWRRISSLFERGVASEKQRDDARSALETAQAELAVVRARLESAQINLDYTEVTAPIPGIAGRRAVSAGNLVGVGDRLVSIEEIDPIQVLVSFPVDDPFADSPALNPHPENRTPAELVDVVGPDGEAITGELNYRAASIDRGTNSMLLRGVFDNPGDVLRPNRYVRVRLLVAEPKGALIVPETAIGTGAEPGSTVVFVVDDENAVEQRRVTLGPMSEQGRIIESGLESGDRIVADGLLKVRPGATIEPQEYKDESR
ncbi:efflux RND transporter periplasmic adaptor subunit [Guyparkeria sp.]|uniref:efflux RND transporter periplasmic adaptor subunit n=1 Tax=Guyparkeria sp. TaxID=2035736 RepID=UPI003970C6AF